MQMSRSKWFQPLVAVGLGVLFLAAMWMGETRVPASTRSVVMVGFGALILRRRPQRDGSWAPRRRS